MTPEIPIYGPIGDFDETGEGVTVREITERLAEIGPDATEIKVPICSDGGSVSQGVAIANALRRHPAKIHTICESAYSIAGLIFCAGDRRSMREGGVLHLHGPHSVTQGNIHDHQSSVRELELATNAMADRYSQVSTESRESIIAQFSTDRFLSADEAVELGYATEKIGDLVTASRTGANGQLIRPGIAIPRSVAVARARNLVGRAVAVQMKKRPYLTRQQAVGRVYRELPQLRELLVAAANQ
jgi:ATP-dependent protease ClpP protease subunit